MDAPDNSYSSNHHNRWLGRRVVLLLGGLAAALPASLGVGIVASPAASAAQTLSQTFSFNDATQYFTVPAGVTSLGLMAEGGSGGRGAGPGTLYVGGGQAVTETVPVNPGDTLVIEVGGAGGNASGNTGGAAGLSSGDGMNGGAGANTNAGVDGYAGGGGGGGTEVVDATVGRVLVAAGGGGGAGGDASYGGGSGAGTGAAGGDPGSGPYGAGGAGGAYASSGALAGANGNTPSPATLSGGGGGGGGGYFVPSLYGGGGNGGAGGGWVSYESGGGGGGGGDSYSYAPATYGGNTGDAGEVEVSWAAPPTATTTTIAVSPGSVDVNQTYSVDAFVSGNQSNPPTGTVQFSSGGAIIGTAQLVEDEGTDEATFTATAPSEPGTVTWQAQYLGDSGASGSPGDAPSASITASETVEAIVTTETTTTLTADTKTCSVGATCPLTVTVTGIGQPAPSGRVALDSSAIDVPLALDSAGQATFDYTPESAGSLTWTAEYFGDNYNSHSISAPVSEVVAKGVPHVTLESSPETVAPGKKYSVTAVVSGGGLDPAGTVAFTSGGKAVRSVALVAGTSAGTATATLRATAPAKAGNVLWKADYKGGVNYRSAKSAVDRVVVQTPRAAVVVPSSVPAGVAVTGDHPEGKQHWTRTACGGASAPPHAVTIAEGH